MPIYLWAVGVPLVHGGLGFVQADVPVLGQAVRRFSVRDGKVQHLWEAMYSFVLLYQAQ